MSIEDLNLQDMTIEQLDAVIAEAQAELKRHRNRRLYEAYLQVLQIATSQGLSIEDLLLQGRQLAAKPKFVSDKSEPRYRNPENPAETWSGRGRSPGWVKARLARGYRLEELKA